MRILFMGTPDFAATCLDALYAAEHDICGVFTQPDKPKNRGMKLAECAAKITAKAHNTPVYQPNTLRDGAALEIIKELAPELIVVVAYGKILPEEILDYPKYGCVNMHASILPKYRGAAPIQWTVLNGDETAGVTAMYMDREMDTGDIISIKTTKVGEEETSGELFDRLALIAAELLTETVLAISDNSASRTPQNHNEATYAPPLKKEQAEIDWTCSASEVLNHIRGMNPWPVATSELGGVRFKIYKAVLAGGDTSKPAGTVLAADKTGLTVNAGEGAVCITELQAPNAKRMSAADYLRGHPIC